VGEIEADKCIETTFRLRGELSNKRREQVATALLVGVPKIKVKISHRCQSAVAEGNDVLNDRGANPKVSDSRFAAFDSDIPEYALPRARYKKHV
jgi:hypothetical protein